MESIELWITQLKPLTATHMKRYKSESIAIIWQCCKIEIMKWYWTTTKKKYLFVLNGTFVKIENTYLSTNIITTFQSGIQFSFSHHLPVERLHLQIKDDFEWQIFEKLFHGNFIYSHSFDIMRSPKKYFLFHFSF